MQALLRENMPTYFTSRPQLMREMVREGDLIEVTDPREAASEEAIEAGITKELGITDLKNCHTVKARRTSLPCDQLSPRKN